jgi:hypothetical protein
VCLLERPGCPSVESPGEILTTKCLRHVHHQVSELTMSYPQGIFLQLTSPTMTPFHVIPRDVPGCYWNDVEAPQGPRLRMNLKAIFAVK